MNILKKSTLVAITILTVISCKYNQKTAKTENKTFEKTEQSNNSSKSISALVGNYVSEDYTKRNEGYDWVAVSVHQLSDSTIHISVRSRADKKKPTCTFDANATKIGDDRFKTSIDGKSILFTFKDSKISITTEKEEDKDILNYYCSGGGSLADTYKKINGPLDEKQIDRRVFNKILSLQGIGFDISSTGKGSIQQLTIQPYGLKTDNKKVTMEVDGMVTNAEIEDLNADGFPEILIYTTSAGSGSYGNVIGYSVNNGKSLSQIYFPPIAENPKANKGYMGHDEFAIVESSLVRRFKTYNEGDTNSNPTGNIRQIQYKLKAGEASRKFVVTKIIEYHE
jgi:hypothetical protein